MSLHPVPLQPLLQHLETAATLIAVTLVEDPAVDGFALVRRPDGPPAEVAILHDGSERGRAHAAFMTLLVERAPAMLGLLCRAVLHRQADFDAPRDVERTISGADLIDWFSGWRADVTQLLAGTDPASPRRAADASPAPLADTILAPVAADQGWNDASQLGVLLSFLNGLFRRCPAIEDGLRQHLALAAEQENAGSEDEGGDEEPEDLDEIDATLAEVAGRDPSPDSDPSMLARCRLQRDALMAEARTHHDIYGDCPHTEALVRQAREQHRTAMRLHRVAAQAGQPLP